MKKFYFRKSCLKLQILIVSLFFTMTGISQTNYSVSQIPFQVYTANSTTLATADDMNSGLISLSFNFDFFGNVYNQMVVNTNGAVDFRAALANTSASWSLSNTIPNATFNPKNAILGCFHDMDNTIPQGQITYSIVGAAPYRKFVLVFNNQPLYSCTTLRSSFQVILYETLNFIDIQLVNKPTGCSWNGGNTVVGIINELGTLALTPPGRNTGAWAASQEGWRFRRPFGTNTYNYTKCDDNTDGIVMFNLAVAQSGINVSNPSSVLFYESLADAQNNVNPIANLNYTNTTTFAQSIYAFNNGTVHEVALKVINCANDFDLDTVPTSAEDLNADGNLANDDTDHDDIPNFMDNDDDGDIVLTQYEYVFLRNTNSPNAYLDTDNDAVLNYLDNDDDGDGVLTMNEDYNGNFNPSDDDTNSNSIPDYLESVVALGTPEFGLQDSVTIYPNPASDHISIENSTDKAINEIQIYNLNGQLVKTIRQNKTIENHSISELQTGVYIVKIHLEDKIISSKLIKK